MISHIACVCLFGLPYSSIDSVIAVVCQVIFFDHVAFFHTYFSCTFTHHSSRFVSHSFIVFNLIIAVICDAVAIIETEKHDEDEGGEKTDGAHIDEMTQQKIQDLNKQMAGLVFAQQQMQQQIDNLTREYYALQGLDVTSSVET